MPQAAYASKDIEAAQTLLQIHDGSSSRSDHTQVNDAAHNAATVNVLPHPSASSQHHGTCTCCGSGQIISTPNASRSLAQPTVAGPMNPYVNGIAYNLTSNQALGLPTVMGQGTHAPGVNQGHYQQPASRVTMPMQAFQNTNRADLASNASQYRLQQPMSQIGNMQPPLRPSQVAYPTRPNQSSSLNVQSEQSPAAVAQNRSLQAYLFHQQRIAGIAPQNMITMPNAQNGQSQAVGQGSSPTLLRFTRDGTALTPHIPPARFDGVLHSTHIPSTQPSEVHLPIRPVLTSDPANHTITRASQTTTELRNSETASPLLRLPVNYALIPLREKFSQSMKKMIYTRGYSIGNPIRTNGSTIRSNIPVPSHSNDQCEQHNGVTDQQATPETSNEQSQPHDVSGTISTDRDSAMTEDESDVQRDAEFHYLDIPGALTDFPALMLMVITRLGVDDFINTAMASRRFYMFVAANRHLTITHFASKHFPLTSRDFPYACYHKLSIDVNGFWRPSNPEQIGAGSPAINKQPLLKWLKMLRFRENFTKELMVLFDKRGFTFPARCEAVLKKIWFLMDISENRLRVSTVQNIYLWSDIEIFLAIFIFAQIETNFTNHRVGTPRQSLRRLVMAQRNMMLLRNALNGTALRTHFEVLREFMRWQYRPLPYEAGMNLFGVAPGDVGQLQFEYYGTKGSRVKLQRPDELILKECSRRQMDMQKMYLYANTYRQNTVNLIRQRNYTLEPEFPFLHMIIYEAQRTDVVSWASDMVIDKYC